LVINLSKPYKLIPKKCTAKKRKSKWHTTKNQLNMKQGITGGLEQKACKRYR
jgi:hypothetical protein